MREPLRNPSWNDPKDGIFEATLVNEPGAPGAPWESGRSETPTARGLSLWIPGWVAGIAAAVGVGTSLYLIVVYQLGTLSLVLSGVLLAIGLTCSVGGLISPRVVNGRPRRAAPLLGVLGNFGVLSLFSLAGLAFFLQDEFRPENQRRAVRQQRPRDETWDQHVARMRMEDQRNEAEQRAQRQREFIIEHQRQEELRRSAELKRVEEERRQQRLAEEARTARLADFSTGAADELTTDEIVRYRGDPSTAVDRRLKRLAKSESDESTMTIYDEEFDELSYAPGNHRLYALRARRLLSIDLAQGRVDRELVLPKESSNLVVTADGPALLCGRRLVLLDWDLRPRRSAPGAQLGKFWGHPAAAVVFTQGADTHQLNVKKYDMLMVQRIQSTLSAPGSPSPLGLFDLPTNPRSALLVAASSDKLHRQRFTGASREWLPTIDSIPRDTGQAIEGEIVPLSAEAFAVRYYNPETRQANLVVRTMHLRGRQIAMISEQAPEGSPELVSACRGARIYLRQTPRRIIAWQPGFDRVQPFDINASPDRDIGDVKSLTAMRGGVCAQTTAGCLVVVEHGAISGNTTHQVVLVPLETGESSGSPAPLAEMDLPQGDWLKPESIVPLKSAPMLGGLVDRVEDHGSYKLIHLSKGITGATYNPQTGRMIGQEGFDALVEFNPDDGTAFRYAPLPSEFAAHHLMSVGGRPVLRGRKNWAFVDHDLRRLAPFVARSWFTAKHVPVFYKPYAEIIANDAQTGAPLGSFTSKQRAKQLAELGFSTRLNNVGLIISFKFDEDDSIWMYLVLETELFRVKIPEAGSDDPWQMEHLTTLPERPQRIHASAGHLVTLKHTPNQKVMTARIYQTEGDLKMLYEHKSVGTGVDTNGDQFFLTTHPFRKPLQLLTFDCATGKVTQTSIGDRRVQNGQMAAFPGGIMLCDREAPVIVRFKEE